MPPRNKSKQFYDYPNFAWFVVIIFGMSLFTACGFAPHLVPFEYLSVLGTLAKYLSTQYPFWFRIGIYTAWAVHVLEATYVAYVARSLKLNLKCTLFWFLQTLTVGFPSTRLMNKYARQQSKNKK